MINKCDIPASQPASQPARISCQLVQITRHRATNAIFIFYAVSVITLLLAFQSEAFAKNCTKGQPCGNSCISWDKVCHIGEPTPTPTPTPNTPPIASFSIDVISGLAPLIVNVDASTSSDPDSTIASYSWRTSDGQFAVGKNATLTFKVAGNHSIILTVTDNKGKSASTQRSVNVEDSQQTPIASFSVTPTQGKTPLTVNLDASASSDPDGSIQSYQWTSSDGQTAMGQITSLTFSNAGEYTITLTVTDNTGKTATTQQTVTVQKSNTIKTCASTHPAATRDFDGDCKDDILWYNKATGDLFLFTSSKGDYPAEGVPVDMGWIAVGVFDYDKDGQADILWWNQKTGEVYVWLGNKEKGSIGFVPDTQWQPCGGGDLDGNGFGDILWFNQTTGGLYVWYDDNQRKVPYGEVEPESGWLPKGVADFDGDGHGDLLWWNQQTGDLFFWTTKNGNYPLSGVPIATGWMVMGTGDFDGDGTPDILWWNQQTGDVYIWDNGGKGTQHSRGLAADLNWSPR